MRLRSGIYRWIRVVSALCTLGLPGCGDGDKPVLEQPALPTLPNEPSGRPSLNHVPEIITVMAPSSIVAGKSATLAVEATDADGDELAVQWALLEGELDGATDAGRVDEVRQNAGRLSATLAIGKPVSRIVVRVGVRDPHGAAAISDPVAIDIEDVLGATVTRADGTIATIVPWDTGRTQTLFRNEEVTIDVSADDFSYDLEDRKAVGWSAWDGSEGSIHIKAPPSPLGDARLTVVTSYGRWAFPFAVANQPPVVDRIVVPEPLEVGDAASLEVLAHDPDGDALYYSLGRPGEETMNPVFELPTQVAGTFDVWVDVVDSYGSRVSQGTSYTVSSAWRQLSRPSDTAFVFHDMAIDDSSLYVVRFEMSDSVEDTGAAQIQRIALEDGLVSSVGSFESVVEPRFPVSDPSVLAIGTALHSYAGAESWVPLEMSPPCDAVPRLVSGSELYAVTLCQGELVVQAQDAAGWSERLRHATGATEPELANVAASGENLLIQYYARDPVARTDSFVHCSAEQGCTTWQTLEEWEPLRIALAPEGVAYLLGSDSASDATGVIRLWQFDETEIHPVRDGLDVYTNIVAADGSLYVAHAGTSNQCGPFECTVVERYDGTAFTGLGPPLLVSPEYSQLLSSGKTLCLGGHGSSTRNTFAIDVSEATP